MRILHKLKLDERQIADLSKDVLEMIKSDPELYETACNILEVSKEEKKIDIEKMRSTIERLSKKF